MASRTVSESSFELVKNDDETHESFIPKQEEKEENHDVLSLNDDISSEDEISDEESSEEKSSADHTSERYLVVESGVIKIENCVQEGGVVGLTVEIPEEPVVANEQAEQLVTLSDDNDDKIEAEITVLKRAREFDEKEETLESLTNQDTTIEYGKYDFVIPKARFVPKTVEKKKEIIAPIAVEKDPLGALATSEPKIENVEENTQEHTTIRPSIESILMDEISALRYEMDKYASAIESQEDQISRLTRQVDLLEDAEEERKRALLAPPITEEIRGMWRPVKMQQHDTSMIRNNFSFPQRWRSLMSHVSYDYSNDRLSKYNKLCCKTYDRYELKYGVDMNPEGGHARTFIKDSKLVTIWTNASGKKTTEERFIEEGQLHVVFTNSGGFKTTRVYERVKSKTDVIYSIGSACRHYLKFW
ncbi:hypothetical protein CAEBREN_10459 [Caenorhabditis brenneri]|uniref:Uncharacterized protein n=1 Tax=Caenorhabditis brenneri TaxID=135651 RepID=G0NAM4_CAEBE|nr:hypothetical protein CAEBREN_10459 [Caenorhabditis brenneri]